MPQQAIGSLRRAARLVDARGSHTGSQVLLRCFKVEKGLQRKEDYHGLLRLLCPQCSAKVIPLSSLINLRSQSPAKVIFPNLPLSLSVSVPPAPSIAWSCSKSPVPQVSKASGLRAVYSDLGVTLPQVKKSPQTKLEASFFLQANTSTWESQAPTLKA